MTETMIDPACTGQNGQRLCGVCQREYTTGLWYREAMPGSPALVTILCERCHERRRPAASAEPKNAG